MASPGISSICSPVYRNRSARPSPSTTVPSSPATSRCAAWRSTPSFAILMRLGRKAASRMQSGECAASCPARPTLRRSRAADSATSWPPTTTLRVNALTSEPQLRPLPKCCTSSVNPPPRVRGDDGKLLPEIGLQIPQRVRIAERCELAFGDSLLLHDRLLLVFGAFVHQRLDRPVAGVLLRTGLDHR